MDGARSSKGYTVRRWGYKVLERQCVCVILIIIIQGRSWDLPTYIKDQMIDLKLLSRQEALFLLNLQTPEKDLDQSRV